MGPYENFFYLLLPNFLKCKYLQIVCNKDHKLDQHKYLIEKLIYYLTFKCTRL